MSKRDMFGFSGEDGEVIYTMTIRTKSGKVIRKDETAMLSLGRSLGKDA